MYVSMREMLLHASDNTYAVMAVNCVNMEQARAICHAAAAEAAPVIIDVSPRQMRAHATAEVMVPMVRAIADALDVPIALNLDHGRDYRDIARCVRAGFSSVMVDASDCEFDENVRRTSLIARLAHAQGLSVEAELGHVGQADVGDGRLTDLYTDVAAAREFVERTGCDCLAVAIGTAHGSYPEGFVPRLDFGRLAELKESLRVPLVLHGGSGAGESNIKRAVELGISKINVCTDLFRHQCRHMREELNDRPIIDYLDVQVDTQQVATDFIRSYMKMIGSAGRYRFDDAVGSRD